MSAKKLKQIENQIQKIKDELWEMGEMRPGSLTVQYKVPKEKKGPYYQLSYTHKMRSRTQYVRAEFVDQTRQQIEVYKRFSILRIRFSIFEFLFLMSTVSLGGGNSDFISFNAAIRAPGIAMSRRYSSTSTFLFVTTL